MGTVGGEHLPCSAIFVGGGLSFWLSVKVVGMEQMVYYTEKSETEFK
jgi:hypothetical protein